MDAFLLYRLRDMIAGLRGNELAFWREISMIIKRLQRRYFFFFLMCES